METVLLVVQVLVCAALIGIILIQRSETDGFGLGSGSGANLMSGRSQANFMTRATAILATIFILNSLVLSIMASHGGPASIVETIQEQESSEPAVPLAVKEEEKAAPAKAEAPKKEVKKEEAPEVPAAN
jgi:preprotein translocase subunit SecG